MIVVGENFIALGRGARPLIGIVWGLSHRRRQWSVIILAMPRRDPPEGEYSYRVSLEIFRAWRRPDLTLVPGWLDEPSVVAEHLRTVAKWGRP